MTAVSPEPTATAARAKPGLGDRPLGWWGTMLLIATEGTIFALLLFVNFYLRANNHPWPPAGIEDPELAKSTARSILLVGSSFPAALAHRALKKGLVRRFRGWLLLTFAMATAFLYGHIVEYIELAKEFTPTSNAYGSVFYGVTGLHAVHLVVGMLVLAYLFTQSLRGRYDAGGSQTGSECGILYWHFVDAVWVAVFSSLYLSLTLAD